MKRLYISVIILFILSIFAFIYSFIYLDQNKHQTYYYLINQDAHDTGTIKIDKFITDDKLIYKSLSSAPFNISPTNTKVRIGLNRKYVLESYSRQIQHNNSSELLCMENKNSLVNFLAVFRAKFLFLENMPVKRDVFVFDENSPVTYMPLIENYNFKIGRSQGFNTIGCVLPYLPPMSRFVTFTSVKDEYLKIESRKIKTENLIIKIKNFPQAAMWIAKSDHCLIRLEIPAMGLKITRTFSPKVLYAEDYAALSGEYISKEVMFKSKNTELNGTLTSPNKEGKGPAVLLVAGDGPQDRRYAGLFYSISDYLSKNGFRVMSFDKRGVGVSKGKGASVTDEDEAGDIRSAMDFLASQDGVDKDRIGVITHSEGIMHAARNAVEKDSNIKALILMAPITNYGLDQGEEGDYFKDMASNNKWSGDYLKLVMRAARESAQKANGTVNNWAYIMGRRCFLKNIKKTTRENILDTVKKIKTPILILQGKNDKEVSQNNISNIEKSLKEGGNSNYTVTYYGYLGHFFGKLINDGRHRMHYDVDREVIENIRTWLVRNLPETTAGPTPELSMAAGEQV